MDDKSLEKLTNVLERIASALEEMVAIDKEKERIAKKELGIGGLEE